ncbi:hypothetical protein [Nissabacter sp. SGAir0207]|uniref:hypothetical protein n=1 Tax=Nissabacter sp. SGAir0207 TaxID=2126321 RepID=UPI0010CD29C6|nr:hypothetical protein [Nissabacter sp. SGAir0207]QCR38721.1 hypothetical protein C1N62_21530 [Nissabacter sp. SGAir0207]
MALTALERLDLNDELDALLEQLTTAKGLDLLDLNDQIDEVLVKLGYGAAGTPAATPEPEPKPEPAPAPTAPEEEQGAPEIVTRFLAGDFKQQPVDDFISTLNALEAFQGAFITLNDIKAGAVLWIQQRPAEAA